MNSQAGETGGPRTHCSLTTLIVSIRGGASTRRSSTLFSPQCELETRKAKHQVPTQHGWIPNTPGNAHEFNGHEYNAHAKPSQASETYRMGSHNVKAVTLQELT